MSLSRAFAIIGRSEDAVPFSERTTKVIAAFEHLRNMTTLMCLRGVTSDGEAAAAEKNLIALRMEIETLINVELE